MLLAATVTAQQQARDPQLCAACIRKNLSYLAGPELRGRGSGTIDEYHAALYIAHQLKKYGLAPAAGKGHYIQTGTIQSRKLTSPPVLRFMENNSNTPVEWQQGKEMAVLSIPQAELSVPLQKLDLAEPGVSPKSVKQGVALLLKLAPGTGEDNIEQVLTNYTETGAALLLLPEAAGGSIFQEVAKRGPRLPKRIGSQPPRPDTVLLSAAASQQLWSEPDGALVHFRASATPWRNSYTWNVLAKIPGTTRGQEIILLSAHLDHLGVKKGKLYPGADDDASGTTAVMELARALSLKPRPQRTLVFALWGSEEIGLVGARYFLQHPTIAVRDIVANLEFEMIGRADSKVAPDQLWLTGWERTNLGPTLAEHGAHLVGDPHPEQNFFARSDNFALAKGGVVAQTVSSYGLHQDYHRPSDTLSRIDWQHLDSAIGSMIEPLSWLANSDFKPTWNEGGKP